MHPAAKIIIGLIIILVGLALLVDSVIPISGGEGTTIAGYTINWFDNFIIVLTGVIPIFLILVGLFVVWLESDELKAGKEVQAVKEEPKPAEPVNEAKETKPAKGRKK